MILFRVACSNHVLQLANKAAVCSSPPSDVGTGITASEAIFLAEICVSGRKYMYICVVNRFGMFVGVTQRVNGKRDSSFSQQFAHPVLKIPTRIYDPALRLYPVSKPEFARMNVFPCSHSLLFGDF